jgi:hypothetical protein
MMCGPSHDFALCGLALQVYAAKKAAVLRAAEEEGLDTGRKAFRKAVRKAEGGAKRGGKTAA